VGSLHER
jgi:hypothetical protein